MKFSIVISTFLGVALGGGLVWTYSRSRPIEEPKVAAIPLPAPAPAQALLDSLAQAAKSGNADALARHTQALAALGPEALPALCQRLQSEDLQTEILTAYATVLVEAGGDHVLPDLRTFWDSPRARGEGIKVKRPVVLALAKRRTSEFGQAILDFWIEEQDPEVEDLLAQAIRSNPQVNGPLVSQAWEKVSDEQHRQKLWTLMMGLSAQGQQQEEARTLASLKAGTAEARKAAGEILGRPGATNKASAIVLLERDGGVEATDLLLAFAMGQEGDAGLRYQALLAACRKADAPCVKRVADWYGTTPGVRSDVLNAVANSGNQAFVSFVNGAISEARDPSLRAHLQRASERLEIAGNRQRLGLKP